MLPQGLAELCRKGEETPELEYIFHPRSIAIVGVSPDPQKQGYKYVDVLRSFGFKGALYPVNFKGGEIQGLKIYPGLSYLPSPLDYVISTIPAAGMPQLLEECFAKGVKVLQLYTARLGETGKEELKRQEKELVRQAREKGLRILGPNCMGIYYPREGLSFRLNFPKEPGSVAFFSQSAGHAGELVYRSSLRGVCFSKVVSYGNAADINEADLLHYFAYDPETLIIAAYIEGIRDSSRFVKALEEATGVKPVIIYKGGKTEAGGRATVSHTGSIAGSQVVWEALCRQKGVLQAASVEELVDLITTLYFMPPPQGNRVGILGGGGGGSVATADACVSAGLEVPPLPSDFTRELQSNAPEEAGLLTNPVDLSVVTTGKGGTAPIHSVIRLLALSPSYPLLILDVGAEWVLERPAGQQIVHDTLTTVIEVARQVCKPIAVILRPGDFPEEWRWKVAMEEQRRCIAAGLAVYPSIARAAAALSKFVYYHSYRREAGDRPTPCYAFPGRGKDG